MQRPAHSEHSSQVGALPRVTARLARPRAHPASLPARHSERTHTDSPAPRHTRAHACVLPRTPSTLHTCPSAHATPSTHPPHTVTRTARQPCSCRPRHPHSNRRRSCCLPPLPAGVFAKQFPWRHILALTGAAECRENGLRGGDETRGLCVLRLPGRQGQVFP